MSDTEAYYAILDSIEPTPIPAREVVIEDDPNLSETENYFRRHFTVAASWELAPLEGTDRQRLWGERLREDFLKRQEAELDEDCIATLQTKPEVQQASFWIEYEKKGDDKVFDFLLGVFTDEEITLANHLAKLKPLLGSTTAQIEFGGVARKKFIQAVDGIDDSVLDKINANDEAQQADFWILLRRHAAKNVLPFAIGEKSIQEIIDKNNAKNPARRFYKHPIS